MNLYQYVSDSIKTALAGADGLAGADLSSVSVEVPRDRSHGDFSTNAAMVLTKQLGCAPRAIAEMILPKIGALDFVEQASIAGPGFINIKLKDGFILSAFGFESASESVLRIDLDYGAYNVAKSLHIGHLRTSIVGDTFNRIARHLGHKTISYNHIGDWGRSMGLVIAWIKRLHPEWPFFQNNFDATKDYSSYAMPAQELDTYYPAAADLAKRDEDFMEQARLITAELQKGNLGYNALYNVFMPVSLASMENVIGKLNILPFDRTMGERNAAKYIKLVEKLLREKNLLKKDDGAEIIIVKKDSDNAPMPPVMFYNSRGAVPYDATDIMALYYRKITDNPDKVIYFTDARQNLHFQQLFRVAQLADLFAPENLEHIGYGTINGQDGKPFKTRDGNAAGLLDIIEMVEDAARARVAESGKNLPENTIQMIALAALKFNDLMHDVRADYVFDPNSVTSFEGRTGPYILYTAVRLNAVLKKANNIIAADAATGRKNAPLHHDERNLLLCILDFERIIQNVFDKRDTSLLANYTYELCQLANTFYHNCPILRDDIADDVRAHRISIAAKAQQNLSTAINLMGLNIPDEM
jgi:arginyl-tRNA synthetase